ncbi:hypothetical protein KUTeg_018199 [Tegillarca granosa]|uniref:Uncharacterized protein n=1 Tax=Tegillarca granosa TaxID=220873 RepID=A0ABQ9EL63_TEGGR|nr:hypothetical protein KUTeg_018199 [Tegillarca granosa]
MISCKRFRGRHTADRIRQEYEETLAMYDMSDKIRNVITGNAANMKKALNFSLPGFPDILVEEKNQNESDDETDNILENEKRLQTDNATRSILSVPEEKLAKTGVPSQLSPYERKLLKELCSILKPFEDATIMVQKDKSVSSSLVVPIFIGLTHQLDEIYVAYNNKMVHTLKSSLDERLGKTMSDDNFLLAAMLDPTIKLRWCNEPEAMEEKLLLNARKYQTSSSQVESSDIDDSPPQKRSRMDSQASGIFSFMTPKKIEFVHYLVIPQNTR